MKVALAVNKITSDIENNFENIKSFIRQAGDEEADLILFPETALTGLINNDDPEHDLKLGIEIPGKYTDQLCQEAKDASINVAIGVFERDGSKLYDSAFFITREGEIGLKYREFPGSGIGPIQILKSIVKEKRLVYSIQILVRSVS